MLEVIDVLDTVERLDGLFVDIQLMSDGNTVMSAPYAYDPDDVWCELMHGSDDDCHF